jgi:hypothetical protein
MHPVGRSHNSFRTALAALAVAAAVALPAHAAVVNKYTFNANNANDSVGGQHGTIVDNTGISTFTGGALNLSANGTGATVAGSNQNFSLPTTVGAYVDLPNGVFTSAVNSGTFGQVTLEIWAIPQENRNWARLVDFGTSDGGENVSGGAGGASYVIMLPQNGINGQAAASSHNATNEPFAFAGAPLPVNVRSHMVAVYDQFDTNGGVNPNGSLTLYVNNGAPVKVSLATGFALDLVNDNNNWLGRAQWPDPLFDGLIDEFRIHDTALTAAEVAASFTAGPEPAPLPVLVVNRDTGAISLANQSAGSIQIKGYSIGSAAGSLNPAAWTSVDAGNTFDANGTWTSSSSTATLLAESVTGGTLDGGSLTPGASAGVGTPWLKTPFADVTFSFTLGDNSTGTGIVQYTGTAAIRSDLSGDGVINAADWAIFVPNSYTSLTGQLPAQAYLKGDLDGDLDNDFADFRLFKSDFIAANGEAAFAALVGAVPEPNSVLLLTMATITLAAVNRRRG